MSNRSTLVTHTRASRRRIVMGIAAVTCIAVVATLIQVLPAGASAPSTAPWMSIVNKNSMNCVDARSGASSDHTPIQQYQCNNTFAQQFELIATDSGYFRVANRNNPNEVLDVTNASYSDGAQIQLYHWWGHWAQQWSAVPLGGGYYNFKSRLSGKCLDVPGASMSSGLQVQQYSCNNTDAQSFLLMWPGTQIGRGDVRSATRQSLGFHVLLDHGQAQDLVAEYGFQGGVATAVTLLSKVVPVLVIPAAYISSLTGVWNRIAQADQGYGVIVDIGFAAPFVGGLAIAVSSQ
jgi:Ricin-type beta-trefoil lectin domain